MRLFPWRKRADEAHREAQAAKAVREQVERNQSFVDWLVGKADRHSTQNGWTETVTAIFGGLPTHEHH